MRCQKLSYEEYSFLTCSLLTHLITSNRCSTRLRRRGSSRVSGVQARSWLDLLGVLLLLAVFLHLHSLLHLLVVRFQMRIGLIQLDLHVVELVLHDVNGIVSDLHLVLELTGADTHLLDSEDFLYQLRGQVHHEYLSCHRGLSWQFELDLSSVSCIALQSLQTIQCAHALSRCPLNLVEGQCPHILCVAYYVTSH
jgi:hypothetical protein